VKSATCLPDPRKCPVSPTLIADKCTECNLPLEKSRRSTEHLHTNEGTLLARIDRGATMDPVTSPLIHKDSGRQARVDPGEENPFHPVSDQARGDAERLAPTSSSQVAQNSNKTDRQ
jgi:hypothetical protein